MKRETITTKLDKIEESLSRLTDILSSSIYPEKKELTPEEEAYNDALEIVMAALRDLNVQQRKKFQAGNYESKELFGRIQFAEDFETFVRGMKK